ncbi:L10-interacting MYB domain-containing protein-like isoform X2 [Telopea speciosissima]|nr:L10-interacting MYB domain-containing protein-like isoform X2 [Telopea speciosissima]XP_043714248.1 L10-interacting MYB domain-containing protein-like isoform X2 [Telopea speciosissima]
MDDQPNQNQFKQDRLRTRWTASLDKIFADLVVEQVQQGKRSNNVFDKKTWKYIRDEFNKQTGLNFDKKQLRKHLTVLRTRYYNMKSVFDQSGIGFNESQRLLTAGCEPWEDYFEAHPKPEAIKIKECPIYEQLCTIFSESGADGMYAQSSHYAELDRETAIIDPAGSTSCPKAICMAVDPSTPSVLVHDDPSSPSGVELHTPDGRKKRRSKAPSSPCHRRQSHEAMNDALAEAMLEMAASSKLRAEAAAMSQNNDQFSITNCIRVLDEMPGVNHYLYFAALDLFEKPIPREIFLSLKSEKRLTWLQGKLSASLSVSMV